MAVLQHTVAKLKTFLFVIVYIFCNKINCVVVVVA